MDLKLLFLEFEVTDNGDDTQTLEAMASVRPPDVDKVLHEVTQVLNWGYRHCAQGPCPLEDGGEWDVLLQAQVNDSPPVALHHDPHSRRVLGLPQLGTETDTPAWVAVTLTVAATSGFAQALQAVLQD